MKGNKMAAKWFQNWFRGWRKHWNKKGQGLRVFSQQFYYFSFLLLKSP